MPVFLEDEFDYIVEKISSVSRQPSGSVLGHAGAGSPECPLTDPKISVKTFIF